MGYYYFFLTLGYFCLELEPKKETVFSQKMHAFLPPLWMGWPTDLLKTVHACTWQSITLLRLHPIRQQHKKDSCQAEAGAENAIPVSDIMMEHRLCQIFACYGYETGTEKLPTE